MLIDRLFDVGIERVAETKDVLRVPASLMPSDSFAGSSREIASDACRAWRMLM